MALKYHYGTAYADNQYGTDADADIMYGGYGNDVQKGAGGNDALYGDAGNDMQYGGAGSDYLSGGTGDDLLSGGSGADYLVGGTGYDTADYSGSYGGVNVDLAAGRGYYGDAEGDLLYEIENVTGSSYNDSLYGNAGDNSLKGGAGDDVIKGGGGTDNLTGGTGADVLMGGDGTDIARYDNSSAGVYVSLSSGQGWYGDAQGDTLYDIEGLAGSKQADTLIGNNVDNWISGNDGNDYLMGLAGNDTLKGGGGANSLVGGAGKDIMEGGAGQDAFVITGLSDSGASAGARDVITDFRQGDDHIDLSLIDAKTTTAGNNSFNWIGTAGFTGQAGQLHETFAWNGTQWNTIVEADVNGDRVADMQIEVAGVNYLNASDFFL